MLVFALSTKYFDNIQNSSSSIISSTKFSITYCQQLIFTIFFSKRYKAIFKLLYLPGNILACPPKLKHYTILRALLGACWVFMAVDLLEVGILEFYVNGWLHVCSLIMNNIVLIKRIFTVDFVIPDFSEFCNIIRRIYDQCRNNCRGKVSILSDV